MSQSFRNRSDLERAIPDILAAPKDEGVLEAIVVRPAEGERRHLQTVELSLKGGAAGDSWAKGCWMTTNDGSPHPDVQIALMSSRSIRAIAGQSENWGKSGNNLFVDLELTHATTPPGTRLTIGTAELIVTETRMSGCESFIGWYGRDACVFVNRGHGKELNMRGVYARVAKDGVVSVGDVMRKIR